MSTQTIADIAKLEDLESVKAAVAELGKVGQEEMLQAAYHATPEVRRYLAELACAEPLAVSKDARFAESHGAVLCGTAQAMARADERGADWNAPYYPWQGALSPLEIAIDLDELAIAKALLERGVSTTSAESRENWPKTALSRAIDKRNYEAVRMLMRHGVAVTQSADLPPIGFDLEVLDELIDAGLDLDVVAPGAMAGAVSWGWWSHPIDTRIAFFRALAARGYRVGLAQLEAALDGADNDADAADALCEVLLELGGETLRAELSEPSADLEQLTETTWEKLSLASLERLVEAGLPITVKRIKRAWTDADGKQAWLEQRRAKELAAMPSLGELLQLSDDQLTPEIVAGVLVGATAGANLGGIAIGDTVEALEAVGLPELDNVWQWQSDSDESTELCASNGLEVFTDDDGKVSGINYELLFPDDARPEQFFAAIEQTLEERQGKKGKGRKGKKREWQLDERDADDNPYVIRLTRSKRRGCYPLEAQVLLELA